LQRPNHITVFEHQKLLVTHPDFDENQMKALLKLNEFHGGKYLDGLYNGVKFKHYVGLIQVDGLTIEILPKIDESENPAWRDVLIQMLKRTGRLKARTLGAANVRRQNLNLLEIYFEYFLSEVEHLQRIGLIKKYRKETNNVHSLKGKLEMTGHVEKNLIHKERFYTTHQVYDKNHSLHQILKVALDIVKQFTSGSRLSDHCNRVLFDFPIVDKIRVNEQLLNRITLNRTSSSYSYALDLARLIILNYSPDIAQGGTRMLSLLFNMNTLWEDYVLAELRRVSDSYSVNVIGKEERNFWGANSLEPDIVLMKSKRYSIIDTKWKRPGNSPSPEDIRQMYAYARFWNAERVMLLYPGEKPTAFSPFLNEELEELHVCKMGFATVLDSDQLSDNLGIDILKIMELP
jgi:5-methylcytosine-specific restriction enzyme subunit McrC